MKINKQSKLMLFALFVAILLWPTLALANDSTPTNLELYHIASEFHVSQPHEYTSIHREDVGVWTSEQSIFVHSEGDIWFNRKVTLTVSADPLVDILENIALDGSFVQWPYASNPDFDFFGKWHFMHNGLESVLIVAQSGDTLLEMVMPMGSERFQQNAVDALGDAMRHTSAVILFEDGSTRNTETGQGECIYPHMGCTR